MQNERLQELKRLAEAATPGPWEAQPETDDECCHSGYSLQAPGKTISDEATAPSDDDALFIAALRNAAPELIAIAEESGTDNSRATVAAATDLTKMLREKAVTPFGPGDHSLLTAAADEIDRLAAQQAQAAPVARVSHAEEGFADVELLGGVKVGDELYLATPAQSPASPQEAKDAALRACREFLGDMHCMPVDWTIKESTILLQKVDAAIAAMSAPAEPQPSAAGGAQTYEQIMDELDAAAVTKSIARNRAKR